LYIKNRNKLLPEDLDNQSLKLRELGLNLIEKAVKAVKPDKFVRDHFIIKNNQLTIREDIYNLKDYDKIHIIGGGKAALEMLCSVEEILLKNNFIQFGGIINIPKNQDISSFNLSGKVKINLASHPVPSEGGIKGTKAMMAVIDKSSKDDLLICLISGGGSALLPLPKKGISLTDLQKINSLLLASGASVHEINTIRKHISDFKGGNLAKRLFNSSGAPLITLIISDVIGDNLDSIASGPTVPDSTSYRDTLEILKHYSLIEKIPQSIIKVIQSGMQDIKLENPKKGDVCFDNTHNYLIGSVKSAVIELQNHLKDNNYWVKYFSDQISGEARIFGKNLIEIMLSVINSEIKVQKVALIGTGELTVTINGTGIGGRNQEMLLSFLETIEDSNFQYKFMIIGANLDGIEGNSEVMGALIDNVVLSRVKKERLRTSSYLENNDSYNFFNQMNTTLETGPTGCNVNDLILILIEIERYT
jgi:glycerate-2-kinase